LTQRAFTPVVLRRRTLLLATWTT